MTISVFACENKECENFEKDTDPIHSDSFTGEVVKIMEKALDGKKWIEVHKRVAIQSICKVCSYRMKKVSEEDTDIPEKPELHKRQDFITADKKKTREYYTRWTSTVGGRPEFNPVTETGGKGGGKTLD